MIISRKTITLFELPPVAQPLQQLPSLVTRAVNLVKAAPDIIMSGGETVPEEVLKERLVLCAHCPGNHWIAYAYGGKGGCAICGCCPIKHEFAVSSCPIGVWNAYHKT